MKKTFRRDCSYHSDTVLAVIEGLGMKLIDWSI